MLSSKISIYDKKSILQIYNLFLSSSKIFIKNLYKVALENLFNAFILFNTVFNLTLKFKLKIAPKMHTFKNLEEIWKTWKKF